MTVRNIKTHLNLLEIFDKNQLDSNDIDYWWQKKFKDTQSNKNISYEEKQNLLIEINKAKDELNEIEVAIIKNILNENQNNNYKSSNNNYSDSDNKYSENKYYEKKNTSNNYNDWFYNLLKLVFVIFLRPLLEFFGLGFWEGIIFICVIIGILWILVEIFYQSK